MIVGFRLLIGKPVTKGEKVSTFIIFCGALFMCFDPSASKSDSATTNILLGDSLALVSGVWGTFCVLAMKHITLHIPNPR